MAARRLLVGRQPSCCGGNVPPLQSCMGQPGGKDRLRGERWHLLWAWRGLVVPRLCAPGGEQSAGCTPHRQGQPVRLPVGHREWL